MARMTLAIDDDLLRRRRGLLRQALAEQGARPRITLSLRGWTARQQPGVDLLDRDKLFSS